MEHLQHYLVEKQDLLAAWELESVGTEKCLMLAGSHPTSDDSVLSFSSAVFC